MPADAPQSHTPAAGETAALSRADGADLVLAALDHLRGDLSADGGPSGPPTLARQKEDFRQWAGGLGLLLTHSNLPAKVVRGGQEHDIYHDEATDRYFKVTRDGVFGAIPGQEMLSLKPKSELAIRLFLRFHQNFIPDIYHIFFRIQIGSDELVELNAFF